MAKRASKPVSFDTPLSFADPAPSDSDVIVTKPEPDTSTPAASVAYPGGDILAGAEALADGKPHVGVAIAVSSGMQDSIIMMPDVTVVSKGESPIYITRPITLKLEKLTKFLENKKIKLPKELDDLLKDTTVACDAFYFTPNTPKPANKPGPKLMQFRLQFKTGLIGTLTGDKDIGDLFDIKGVYVRFVQCEPGQLKLLTAYAAELAGEDKQATQ